MHHNQIVANNFSKGADSWNITPRLQDRVNAQLFQHILSHEPDLETSMVLEVGCGTGGLSKELAPLSKTYILSDISPNMVKKACHTCPSALPIVFDAEHPSFMAGFDIIASSLTLHWLQDPKQGLHQLIGCLKPG